jgi:pentatricopeptide repeat protein
MDEMLGNHYYLSRNYGRAAELLDKALRVDPKNKPIRRKLIICFAQTGHVDKALEIFLSLVKEDIDFIINTDPVDDDCPCPELVFEMEHGNVNNQESLDTRLVLGMLWLYCNLQKSFDCFIQASTIDENNKMIKSILALLEVRLQQENTGVG